MGEEPQLLEIESPARDRARLPYSPQLDGVRAVAIALVMVSHLWPPSVKYLPLGGAGVQLFFVLSGFLITRILLRSRAAAGDKARGHALLRFYVRRWLRISPIYYLTLGVLCVLGVASVRRTIGWHLAYLTNVFIFKRRSVDLIPIDHFWSLAVEEQFYLIWPWIVLWFPRRRLGWVAAAIAVSAVAFRGWSLHMGWRPLFAYVLLFANVDTLGAGALLAILWESASPNREQRRRAVRWISWLLGTALIVGFVALHAWSRLDERTTPRLYAVGFNIALALGFIGWIDAAAAGMRGPIGVALSWGPVRYIGKISYGLYVYHYLLARWWTGSHHSADIPVMAAIGLAAASVAIAALSWHLIESPINALKRFVPYGDANRPPSQTTMKNDAA